MFLRKRRANPVDELTSLCQELLSHRGDVSGARLAAEAIRIYRALDPPDLEAFFDRLVARFSPDLTAAKSAAEQFGTDASLPSFLKLQQAVESPRQELFRRWNIAPGGTATLLGMRKRLLGSLQGHPERAGVDTDLLHLFRSWFNRGFLVLQRIDWRTPAVILERLIEYEAVHQIQGWRDLRRRLESDRRCFAFFHPALPEEPLIFIEVALTRGLSAEVRPLIDPNSEVGDASRADTAMFYSITNCQEGLRGVSFGNVLIKQVVADLGGEFRRLRTFATLSPIPRFRDWLIALDARWSTFDASTATSSSRKELLALCAQYLLYAKREHEPADSVARFHLANGASLERLNWMADTSPAGLQRSFGLMANYLYNPDNLERNHEIYAREYGVIASRTIERLARLD
jgi:malonyl-CoA decarboxylase